MTKLFQQEKTKEDIVRTLEAQNLAALKNQLSQVMQENERLLSCLEKIKCQTKDYERRNKESKVISLLHRL